MIRSELDVLLDKIEDSALQADLRSQIDRLKQRRSFGLVFEQHIPERVRLPQHSVRVGSQVVSRTDDDSPTFEVVAIEGGVATLEPVRNPDGSYVGRGDHSAGGYEHAPLDSLVVITDFGEPVLPGFRFLGAVERGGDKPYHVVINGENYHALEALRFAHAGKVDCIYLDPPYNSGARDWKYNNDYVDDTDAYRHSKWLAFMERRLKLAQELLNPDDSVLIVAIDEREVHRLGLLLEQTMPGARIQMVSSVINPSGSSREGLFARSDEYIYFALLGRATVRGHKNMSPGTRRSDKQRGDIWNRMLRGGTGATRLEAPGQFYPVWVDPKNARIHSIGDPLPSGMDRDQVSAPRHDLVACWPLRSDGTEGRWQIGAETARKGLEAGTVRLGGYTPKTGRWAMYYLRQAELRRIQTGEIRSVGKDKNGVLILEHNEEVEMSRPPTTRVAAEGHRFGRADSRHPRKTWLAR